MAHNLYTLMNVHLQAQNTVPNDFCFFPKILEGVSRFEYQNSVWFAEHVELEGQTLFFHSFPLLELSWVIPLRRPSDIIALRAFTPKLAWLSFLRHQVVRSEKYHRPGDDPNPDPSEHAGIQPNP